MWLMVNAFFTFIEHSMGITDKKPNQQVGIWKMKW